MQFFKNLTFLASFPTASKEASEESGVIMVGLLMIWRLLYLGGGVSGGLYQVGRALTLYYGFVACSQTLSAVLSLTMFAHQ